MFPKLLSRRVIQLRLRGLIYRDAKLDLKDVADHIHHPLLLTTLLHVPLPNELGWKGLERILLEQRFPTGAALTGVSPTCTIKCGSCSPRGGH